MELRHDPNKDTATTITLEWTPVPGAQGYRFSSSDTVKRSHTWDPTRSSVKFSKGADWYRVEALGVVDTGQWPAPTPPPPPPPPPPPAKALFDGRATALKTLTGAPALNQDGYCDPPIWNDDGDNGVNFMGDDIRLVDDPTYTKAYLCEIGKGSQNPYWTDGVSVSGEVCVRRPVAMGQWDWYSTAFRLEHIELMDWHVISQFAYPTLSSPPLSISFDSNGLGIDRHVGIIRTGNYLPDLVEKPRFWSVSDLIGKWVEMAVGVKYAVDSTGEIRVYARVRDLGDTQLVEKFAKTGTPTFQQKQGQSLKTTGLDKMGLYFGDGSSWPTNVVRQRGIMRFADEASARASLG